jgi:hypothetical protein
MALPVVFLSLARSDGVLEYWSVEKKILPDTGHVKPKRESSYAVFRILKFFLQFQSITPALHYSNTPVI